MEKGERGMEGGEKGNGDESEGAGGDNYGEKELKVWQKTAKSKQDPSMGPPHEAAASGGTTSGVQTVRPHQVVER